MKTVLYTNGPGGSRVYLSDEHASSSHGIPVLVVEEKDGASLAFGPKEDVTPGLPAYALAEMFLFGEKLPPGELRRGRRTWAAREAARRFCGAAPFGRGTAVAK